MKVTCLGSGDAFKNEGFHSSFLINEKILLDCPPDILSSLENADISPSSIEIIFITHFHADHFFGLPFLFIESLREGHEEEVTVVGPKGIDERAESLLERAYPDIYSNEKSIFNYMEVEETSEYKLDGLRFQTYGMKHGGDALKAIGYSIIKDDKRLGFTGDTGYSTELEMLATDVDMLISECEFSEREADNHLNISCIKELVENFFTEGRLLLTHIAEVTDEIKGLEEATIAEDGEEYRL